MIDNQGDSYCLWMDSGFSKRAQSQFNQGFGLELWAQMNRATGATMAFRKEIIKKTNDELPFDSYLYEEEKESELIQKESFPIFSTLFYD